MKKNNAARALRGFITLLAIVLIDSSVLREALAE